MYLSCAAALDTIPYFMGNDKPTAGPGCSFQAFWMSYFDWSVLLWVCIISLNVYLNLIHMMETERYEHRYHMLGWGFPLLPALIPLFASAYGPAGAWCWIEGNDAMRFALWYVPLFTLIFGLGIVYTLITLRVNRNAKRWQGTYNPEVEEEKRQMKKAVQPLRFYPLVYLLCSIFGLVNRIQNAASPGTPIFALYLLHSLTAPMQGLLNALVYATSGGFWRQCTPSGIKRAAAKHGDGGGDTKEYPMAPDGDELVPDYGESSDEEIAGGAYGLQQN
eukprot:UC1_evm1s154